jgi:SAM-dependent methyltransferase
MAKRQPVALPAICDIRAGMRYPHVGARRASAATRRGGLCEACADEFEQGGGERAVRSLGRQLRARSALALHRQAAAGGTQSAGAAAKRRFLDVGCGTGAAVRAAAALVDRAVGLDISLEMIDCARKLAAELPRAEFVVGDGEQLPFPAASFHHYPAPKSALAEMARVLAADGRLVIADPTADRLSARIANRLLRRFDRGHFRLYRSDELVERVSAAGFDDVAVRRLWGGGYMIVSGRRAS